MPPRTAAVNALIPAMKPINGLSLPIARAINTPPTAANIAPTTKVKEMTRLVSIPSILAMPKSWELALEARPMREYLIYKLRAIMSTTRSEEHTSELQSRFDLVCRLLLEKKKQQINKYLI